MATIKPAAVPSDSAYTGSLADTSKALSSTHQLNQPMLLGVDTLGGAFPNVFFCGEQVPIYQSSVLRRWKQTLLSHGYRSDYLNGLRKRAAGFFPVIDPILRQYGIPRDFRYLPLAESDLIYSAVSPKGASGYWQLMPQTARELGLVVSPDYDERFDLRKATIAACRHLRYLYSQLGSWTLVAAAYNGGEGQIQSRMKRQNQKSYYDLRLNRETSYYLFRVLALKELLTNPWGYTLVLPTQLIKSLSRPLSGRIFPVMSFTKRKRMNVNEEEDVDTQLQAPPDTDPTWGPRVVRSLLNGPSDVQQWLANAVGANKDTNADLTKEQGGIPIKKLMALMVLRFRRPRFLQLKKGSGNRPRHFWEWV
ncbi:lytic transglycosylase domain-containing protein [Nibrella saemangeumensis]